MFLKTVSALIVRSLAAPVAWLMVGLLRGEHLTCAQWPSDGILPEVANCNATGRFPLPCQIPKTYEKPIVEDDCPAVYYNIY